jgi:hypothetical protein
MKIEKLVNDLGNAGIYTLIDAHQDVFARMMCGEGMPNFYAREVTANASCSANWTDPVYQDLVNLYGPCRSINVYNYTLDENGNPLPSECQKHMFAQYYTTSESLAAFDALYTNKFGL